MPLETVGTPALWAGFIVFVLAMLVVDLGVFHRRTHAVSLKEAGVWSAVWVALALAFNAGVYALFGPERALEFTTGYLIEKALAVDNIFVWLMLFTYFAVPAEYQRRVLLSHGTEDIYENKDKLTRFKFFTDFAARHG